ncbi:stalk domain-containing protein [Cohnella faecalis]|uniref:Uncharacterized protein n=1 Tax=Cohnella faecalis TaxID=2315694 RepID=A0A398CEQ6_9BACL|nr:stalk domain-containing protein [Cohnella faecalis]RIE01193.1 hypothetical protein D3H35_22610 [Cohnella faecalis]
MKRFIMGLICGLALSGASIAVAAVSNEVKATLFPSELRFYIDGKDNTGTEEVSVLKYNNRMYIPLRVFAEKLGSTVDYHAPKPGDTWASVDIFKVDDRDLTVRDTAGYVGMGHVDVQFAEHPTYLVSTPQITGAVKFYKTIPKGKQVVVAVLDKDNQQVAVTEPIQLRSRAVGDMAAGEVATFETNFPYVNPVEGYKLQARLVDETSWTYEQIDGVIQGAGGMTGNPLGVSIGSEHEVKKGQPVEIKVHMVNLSDSDTIVLSQPVSLEVQITKRNGDSQQLIRTLRTAPLTGTIYWRQGSAFTKLVWDQKDDKGRAVPAGEYTASIVLPTKAVGAAIKKPNTTQEYTIDSSMQTQFPIVIQ